MKKTFPKIFLTHLSILFFCFSLLGVTLNVSRFEYLLFVLTALLLSFILSFLVEIFFIRPIKKMQQMASQIAQGHFPERLFLTRKDELGDLAKNLHQMSTELQNKIARIMQDKNELKAILSSMIEGVIVIDKDERILLLTSPMERMLDLRSKEAVGRPYWEVIRHEEINFSLEQALHEKKSLRKEIAVFFPEESHFQMQISCIFLDSGKISGVVAVFHDVTELKKFTKLRSEFVANVSHELKTPLTTIKGFVETLKEGALEDKNNAAKFLEIIEKHTLRLENLVNDLLTLSSIESKEIPLNLEMLPLSSILESAAGLFKERLTNKQLKLSLNIADNLPSLKMDRAKIEQVLENLLDNAIKFTPEGGSISIKASWDNGFVRIDVKDTGIGIEAKHLSRLFERFYRVDKGRSRELGGTGLGLSIVKHIVQLHDGRVAVESEPGKGSMFSIYLPS